ncbi:autotransporter outer membrane beta-barrel domain-containing protein [Devosia limi]|nr:autotransporter outer membrane beta-barrel domain-containing protein [Devosia limi]
MLNSTWTGDVWENAGTINNMDTSTWNGDVVSNSGTIDNYDLESIWNGNILANSGDIYNGGLWEGDIFTNDNFISNYYAQSIWNGDVRANAGTIFNGGTWNGAVLANTGAILTVGTWNGSVINSGTLSVGDGGTAGTLSGDVVNSGTLAFDRSDASTFGGAISGAGVVTKSGAGTLTLTGNATHSGGTTINAGTLQVGNGGTAGALSGNVANAGTLAFNRSDSSTYGGVISGNGAVTKSGAGTLVLSGTNTYIGATSVNAGTLSVSGSIAASALTVNGGALKGSGTVGTTTIASGILAAGNSIGTLTIAGGLDLGAAAVLQVEVAAGGNALGVHSDLVAVTGAVTIDPGATVQVGPVNSGDDGKTFAADTTYTIITSAGLSGRFASVTDDFAFLDSTLSYDPVNAYLTLKRNDTSFADVAETSNQTGAANALGAFAPGDPVANGLTGLSPADARRAYELASGDSHASGQAVFDQAFSLFQGTMGSGSGGGSGAVMSYVDAGIGLVGPVGSAEPVVTPFAANAVWMTPMAGRGVIESDGNGATTEWAAGGLAVGYERRSTLAGGEAVAGLGVGYTATTTTTPTRLASSNAQGGQVGLYGEWSDDFWAVSGSLSYGANHISSTRDIVIGGLTNTAAAQYWMQGVDATLMAGYGFELSDGLKVGPLAGMSLGWSGYGGFSETGAAGLNATVAASSAWRLTSALGVQFAYGLEGGADEFEISGRALWLHNFGDNVTTSTVTLAGGGAPFSVVSPTSGRDRLELGAGLTWSASEQLKLSVDYTGRFFGGRTDHTARAGLTLEF